MSIQSEALSLPDYSDVSDLMAVLALPMSISALHGQLCAFLCIGAENKGEAYLQTLIRQPKNEATRAAILALFHLFSVSQQQMVNSDFSFNLLLPDDSADIEERVYAFSEWCEGFVKGLDICDLAQITLDEEAEEAIGHIREFSEVDYETLDISEEDEKALMEISEYTRIAVLKLHTDFLAGKTPDTTH